MLVLRTELPQRHRRLLALPALLQPAARGVAAVGTGPSIDR
eukprot:COSAG02_NODE_33726_length_495_cov_1.459596_1_plen_40_part_10